MEPSGLCTAWIVCIRPHLASLWGQDPPMAAGASRKCLEPQKKLGKNNPQEHHECKNCSHSRTITRQGRHFSVATRVYLKELPRDQGRERRSVYHSPHLACFYFAKIAVCHVWVLPCCFFPLAGMTTMKTLHTAFEQVFVILSGIYWLIRIADSELIMCQGMFWAFYMNQLMESSQPPYETDTTIIFIVLVGRWNL